MSFAKNGALLLPFTALLQGLTGLYWVYKKAKADSI
jgi:hypothetical protein